MRLSSKVHTRRAQILTSRAAGVPSSRVSSVASHQHLRCVMKQTISALSFVSKCSSTHSRFPPEQEELLCRCELLGVDLDCWLGSALGKADGWVDNTRLEEDEGDGGDATAVRLERTVTPDVLAFEAAASEARVSERWSEVRGEPRPTSCRACRSSAARRRCSPG